jgi:hypothetical protein
MEAKTKWIVGKIQQLQSANHPKISIQSKTLTQLHLEPAKSTMWITFLLVIWTVKMSQMSPVPKLINGQLLTTKHFNPKEHEEGGNMP